MPSAPLGDPQEQVPAHSKIRSPGSKLQHPTIIPQPRKLTDLPPPHAAIPQRNTPCCQRNACYREDTSCSTRQVFEGKKASWVPPSHTDLSCQCALENNYHPEQDKHIHRWNFSPGSSPAAAEQCKVEGVRTRSSQPHSRGPQYFIPTTTELSNPKQEVSCCTLTPS